MRIMVEELVIELCVRGYHVIKTCGKQLSEELPCEWETRNTKDRYAVAVKKDSTVVGHLRNI